MRCRQEFFSKGKYSMLNSGLFTLQIAMAIFLIILIPYYWHRYGLANFLWLSDVGLFLTALALWFHSPLCISMVTIGILPLEILWMVEYFLRLFTGINLFSITDYMFNPNYPRTLRALSYFHIFVPVICLWYLFSWGYDSRAIFYQTILNSLVLIACYTLTSPKENINWVFMPYIKQWKKISPFSWFLFLLAGTPILVMWPLHFVLQLF
jgi:hypothetical protein